MAKGIPHILSKRPLKTPVVRPRRPLSGAVQVPPQAPVVAAEEAKAEPAPAPAPAKVAAAPAPKKAASAPKAPLEVLEGSVKAVQKELATGKLDAFLKDLLKAEESGKARKSAIDAIKARM